MNLLLDDVLDAFKTALGTDNVDTDFDQDIPGTELDPVARIGEAVEDSATSLPSAFVDDPFDTDLDIDRMTSTLQERTQARRTFEQTTPGSSANFQAAEAATMPGKPTTKSFVRKMLAKEGLPYQWGSTGQPDPETGQKAFDCSGIIYRIMQNFGFNNFPRVSGDIIEHAKPISVKKAINTRGAVLWHEGHIAVSLGNGKTIEAMGEDYGVVIGNAEGRFTKGGLLPELQLISGGKGKGKKPKQTRFVLPKAKPEQPTLASVTTPTTVFGNIMDEIEAPALKARGKTAVPRRGVKAQLYQGFLDAGRKDLAKMVFTKDFDVWLERGEGTGWNPGAVSQPYGGIRNYGLFQFRNLDGRSWLTDYIKGGKFTASAYDQALLVAKYFDLSVDDIHTYADEVRNNSYSGWG